MTITACIKPSFYERPKSYSSVSTLDDTKISLQIGGIRFLYDNIIESVSRFNSSPGFGCILAHTMGLGKTLQTIRYQTNSCQQSVSLDRFSIDCCIYNIDRFYILKM